MVTLRRNNTSDTRRHDYDYMNNVAHRDDAHAYSERVEKSNVSQEYLDYLWAELNRNEARPTLRPEEYTEGRSSTRAHDRVRERSYSHSRASISYNESRVPAMGKLDKKGVIAIVAYFLIVAVIATLIIVNGAGTAGFDPATGTQAEISVGAGTGVNSTAELPIISQQALGVMILSDGSVEDINLLEKADGAGNQPQTNWFDKLCDTLSFIAGG